MVNPTLTEMRIDGARGFIVKGTLGPGYGEGTYAKNACVEMGGKAIIFGCQLNLCQSDLYEQILSTFELTR